VIVAKQNALLSAKKNKHYEVMERPFLGQTAAFGTPAVV
jgi:hypothetical protein